MRIAALLLRRAASCRDWLRSSGRAASLTAAAMIAFAANSLLCRAALRDDLIDAASFTAIRLASGASILWVIAAARRDRGGEGSWWSAVALVAYAIAFSIAYREINAGAGALILFGAVQITMVTGGVIRGERPAPRQWIGIAVALGGLATINAPRIDAPAPLGAAMMAIAGVAWGIYSLRGRGVTRPLVATAGNFARSVPLAAAIAIAGVAIGAQATTSGVVLAVASGAIASGIGYSLWYAAVPSLGATRAAVVQLAVPVIAAIGGIALLGESPSITLVAGGAAIVGGLALTIRSRPAP
jgi:drug/metabolite transporter (DMT)-like permease